MLVDSTLPPTPVAVEYEVKLKKKLDSFYLGHMDQMYAISSKFGSEPFMALGDLTWNDPIIPGFYGF